MTSRMFKGVSFLFYPTFPRILRTEFSGVLRRRKRYDKAARRVCVVPLPERIPIKEIITTITGDCGLFRSGRQSSEDYSAPPPQPYTHKQGFLHVAKSYTDNQIGLKQHLDATGAIATAIHVASPSQSRTYLKNTDDAYN